MIDPVPILLHGEGRYDLTDIKEIQVTESFLALEEKTKKCQTGQSHSDCLTEQYRAALLASCGCAPANLLSFYPPQVSQRKKGDFNKGICLVVRHMWIF